MLRYNPYICEMETKQKEQLRQFEELGLDTYRKTYFECVDILIEKYLGVCDALEYDEEERFRKELLRLKKPTN